MFLGRKRRAPFDRIRASRISPGRAEFSRGFASRSGTFPPRINPIPSSTLDAGECARPSPSPRLPPLRLACSRVHAIGQLQPADSNSNYPWATKSFLLAFQVSTPPVRRTGVSWNNWIRILIHECDFPLYRWQYLWICKQIFSAIRSTWKRK